MSIQRTRHLIYVLPGWQSHLHVRLAWTLLFIVIFLAVFGPLIATEKPYYCKLDGKKYYPAFTRITESTLSQLHPSHSPVDWHSTKFDRVWRAPVPYGHTSIDLKTGANVSPFADQNIPMRLKHWLGTDAAGRDVLAGMIRGCRVSLLIGLGSMLLALLIGVPLGTMAAYWGNREKRISWYHLFAFIAGGTFIFFTWFFPWPIFIKMMILLLLLFALLFFIHRTGLHQKGVIPVPVDQMVMGGISILDGFPAMFLIILLIALLPVKGWVVVMLVIALMKWPTMARYMRAEVFRMKETNYIKAAQVINLPAWRIMTQHIIPYAFRPVMVSFIFGVASAILAESALSFLGIGLPAEEINWGRLLAQSRNHFEAWWLVVFPGSAIFLTLLALYAIGNAWQTKG
jgi:peptide/nickel transport system permease protein